MKADYFNPRPAVLVAASRSGSTFLLHCLDSHPQIGCERVEPLCPKRVWRTMGMDRHDLMRVFWQRPGYRVSMFKLSYRQFRWAKPPIFKEYKPLILHLYRGNVLRVVVSSIINTAAVAGELAYPIHSFEEATKPTRLKLDPADFLARCRKYTGNVEKMIAELSALELPVLHLTYEDLIGYAGGLMTTLDRMATFRICDFLQVRVTQMISETKRVNPWPLAEIVKNWGEVEAAIRKNGEFVECLEDELEAA
jgi:hypothetical protein